MKTTKSNFKKLVSQMKKLNQNEMRSLKGGITIRNNGKGKDDDISSPGDGKLFCC